MSQKKIIIIGAGSVGGHIVSNIDHYFKEHLDVLFLDDDTNKLGKTFCGAKVVGKISDIITFPKDIEIFVGIAFPDIKSRIINFLINRGFNNFPTLISNKSWVSRKVKFGKGVLIYPGCSINYETQIDDFVLMNMNCAIGHDCKIGKYTNISPNVSLGGNSIIKDCVHLGIGCNTLQNLQIGSNTIIGAGAVVIKPLPANCTAVGNPAKPIKFF